MTTAGFRQRLAHRTPFYYGWTIVFAAGSAMFVRNAAASLTLAVFMVPMSEDLGWSRTLLAGAASAAGIAAMFTSPVTGWLVDRFGPRAVLGGSAAVLGLSTMLIGWATVPLAFYVLFGIGRVIFSSPMQIGTATVVSQWFVARRGRATGMLGVSHSLGMGLLPLLAQILINTAGWEAAWFWLGVTVWAVALLPLWVLIIARPEDVGLRPDGVQTNDDASSPAAPDTAASDAISGLTLREAARTPALWLLGTAGGLLFFIHAGVNIHQAAFLRDQGIAPTVAAAALTVLAAGTGIGSMAWGMLVERFNGRLVYTGVAVWLAGVAPLFLLVDSAPRAFVVAALFGVGLGGLLVVPPVVLADYFGRRSLGAIRGATEPFVGGGQAIGGLTAGLIYDVTGDYVAVFPILTGMALMGAVLLALARPPKLPSHDAPPPGATAAAVADPATEA
ncbi:MAG: MFS transporter [Dehalococcoidia bacterium]